MLWQYISIHLSMPCHVKECRYSKAQEGNDLIFKVLRGRCKRICFDSTFLFPSACHVMSRNIDIWKPRKGMIWSTKFWGDRCKRKCFDRTFLFPSACHVMWRNIDIWKPKKRMIWSSKFWGVDVNVYALTGHFYSPQHAMSCQGIYIGANFAPRELIFPNAWPLKPVRSMTC